MNKTADNIALERVLTAYANQHGDMALFEQFRYWLHKHMKVTIDKWSKWTKEDK